MDSIEDFDYFNVKLFLLYSSNNSFCSVVRSILLSFRPTTAVFKYMDTQNNVSSYSTLEDMACGSDGLNSKRSPGLSATARPRRGKQKYATILSCILY